MHMRAIPLPAPVIYLVAWVVDILRRFGVPIPIEGNQLRLSTRMMVFNCQKSWKELGEPRIDIQTSLRETYMWYKAHGDL